MCLALPKLVCPAILPTPGRRTTNSENQLTNIGGNSVSYDSNGNITKDDHGHTLVYNAWNRLAAVYNSSGVLLAGYTYDGYGRMTSETNVTTTTDFYYSGTQDVEERTGVTSYTGASLSSNGTTALVNVYSPDYTNDILLRDSSGTRVYFTHDANYNVTAVLSASGGLDQRMVYDAYGAVKFYNSGWTLQSGDSLSLRYLYQGMRYDAAIGWYFSGQSNVARWYSPTMVVWNREDSAGDVNGLNEYGFVAGNPIDRVDPKGTDFWLYRTGPGLTDHAQAIVTVRDASGDIVGYLTADFSAGGFMGMPAPTHSWNSVCSWTPGYVILTFTTGGDYKGPGAHTAGSAADDSRVLDYLLGTAGQTRAFVDTRLHPLGNLGSFRGSNGWKYYSIPLDWTCISYAWSAQDFYDSGPGSKRPPDPHPEQHYNYTIPI